MFLITRPEEKAALAQQLFESVGLECICCPAIKIARLPDILPSQLNYDFVIVTSTYAAEWLNVHKHLQIKTIICIGNSTEKTLKKSSFKHTRIVTPEKHNSESVLSLKCLDDLTSKSILIVKGKHGRTLLAKTLKSRNAQVEVCEVYERVAALNKQLVRQVEELAITCIIVTSNDIANAMIEHFENAWLLNKHWIVASERVAEHLQTHGFEKISVSLGASNEALLQAALNFSPTTNISRM